MDLLGPSLEELSHLCKRKVSLKSVLMLADQLLVRLEYIHSKNFLHRDVKPDNFLVGLGENSCIVYAIDFGLAKKYRDSRTNQHIPYRDGKKLTGTARYASIFTHLGSEQSRRDDLEGLGYLLVYMIKGSLPWQGLNGETKEEKYSKIFEKKNSTSLDELCWGLPCEFKSYLTYVRNLTFEERPDYTYLRKLFSDVFLRENFVFDSIYDWTRLSTPRDSFNFEDTISQKKISLKEENKVS